MLETGFAQDSGPEPTAFGRAGRRRARWTGDDAQGSAECAGPLC
jgi:hypothetical protein